MGFLSLIKNWFTNRERNEKIAEVMNTRFRLPEDATQLIAIWRDIYTGVSASCEKTTGIATLIAKDLAMKACSELEIDSDGNAEADVIFNDEMKLAIRQQTEYALAMGYVVLRPYYDGEKVCFSWYTADRVLPTAWNGRELRGCVLLDYYIASEAGSSIIYTRLESHGVDRTDGKYHIRTKLFKNYSYDSIAGGYVGQEVPLATVPDWAEITPDIVIENPSALTFVYMGTPIANSKTLNVPVGVSIFKDAVPWLEEFDEAFKSARYENRTGRSKSFISESMIPKKRLKSVNDDKTVFVDDLNALDKEFYKKLDTESGRDLFEKWSPTLRFDSYETYMNFLLHMICILAGLDPGQYVFDEKSYAVTAKEIISKQQKTYHTIVDVQKYMITPFVSKLLQTVRQLQYLYDIPAIPENIELAVTYGDSILVDEQQQKADAQLEVSAGLRSKLSYMIDIRHLTEEEALAEIERIKSDAPSLFTEGA